MAHVLGARPVLVTAARLEALAAGVWLMFAPAVLGHGGTAMADSDRIVGPVAASCAFVALWGVLDGLRWGTLPCGVWAVAAPWVLDADLAAGVSSTVAGVLFAVTAFVGTRGPEPFGGGWRTVRPSAWRTR